VELAYDSLKWSALRDRNAHSISQEKIINSFRSGNAGPGRGNFRARAIRRRVIIVYNHSRARVQTVADYYAQRRQVPTNKCLASRFNERRILAGEYQEKLEKPLAKRSKHRNLAYFLACFRATTPGRSPGAESHGIKNPYACFVTVFLSGITRIDSQRRGAGNAAAEMRRNVAAVDSELPAADGGTEAAAGRTVRETRRLRNE